MVLNNTMVIDKLYGGFTEEIADNVMTSMQFAIPIQDLATGWRRCGSTADFFSKVYAQWFYNQKKSENILSTVVNELVENAAKYSRIDLAPTQVIFRTYRDHLEILTVSVCEETQALSFDQFLSDFIQADPAVFYEKQFLESATQATERSRIGLSVLRTDYDLDLSCKISPSQEFQTYYDVIVKVSMKYEEVDGL